MRLGTVTVTHTRRPKRGPRSGAGQRLPVIVALASLVVIGLHEFSYRRFIDPVDTEYELWGALSHAGSDMLTLAFVVLIAVIVENQRTTGGRPPE